MQLCVPIGQRPCEFALCSTGNASERDFCIPIEMHISLMKIYNMFFSSNLKCLMFTKYITWQEAGMMSFLAWLHWET